MKGRKIFSGNYNLFQRSNVRLRKKQSFYFLFAHDLFVQCVVNVLDYMCVYVESSNLP